MKINRSNYEEYFLLYADNELDAETRLAVENFVEQNTDLAVELDMLLKTKSQPEEIEFADKEILLRTEGININEHNYEEYFLLYIDNELSPAKRAETERYVLQHPKLQKEFTDLKQAVLAPEVISYGDKKDLYRTEKKRAIYLKPWRLAAAAVFIGVCAAGFWLMQKPAKENPVVVIHPAEIQTKHNETVKPADTAEQIIPQQKDIAQQSLPSAQNKMDEQKTIKKKKIVPPVIKNNETAAAENHPSPKNENLNNKPAEQNNIVKINPSPTEDNDVAFETIPSNKTPDIEPVQVNDNNANNNQDYTTYDVAYKEINTRDEENSLHLGAFDLNKNKVKNLFKKAGRLLGNKQDNLANDDGKLQVANFEIQTKQQ